MSSPSPSSAPISALGRSRTEPEATPATPEPDQYAYMRGDKHWSRRKPELVRERRARQEYVRGQAHPKAKLTEERAQFVLDHPELSGSACARKFEVTPAAIYAVRNGLTWRHLRPASGEADQCPVLDLSDDWGIP